MCGETDHAVTRLEIEQGLSPHVRGNLSRIRNSFPASGSIPACAGKPVRENRWNGASRVYPRMCGETLRATSLPHDVPGLSPHVRGNLARPQTPVADLGSIPACAGKPYAHRCRRNPGGVYPRMCGETGAVVIRDERGRGLSPHVRGNHRADEKRRGRGGSIPACAGKPPPASSRCSG